MTAVHVASKSDAASPMAPGASMGATAAAVAARTLRKYMRTPQLLVTSIGSGAIFIVLFRYIFGGVIDIGSVQYVDFLMPGMILTSVLITGTGTAIGVAEDASQGFDDRLRSLPTPRIALLAGRAMGELAIIGVWGAAVTTALGFLVGFRLHGSIGEALLAFALCVVCGFAFVWLFICMGLFAANPQGAQGTSMLIYPIIFVSSAYVPVDSLPGWMGAIGEHQPVTVMCNAVRSLALGDPSLAGLDHTTTYWVSLSLIWSAALVAVFAPVAVTLYRRSS